MIWIFDLDNTLHDASNAIFPAITENMNRFIAKRIIKTEDEDAWNQANKLRLSYWERYGATLLGLIHHHQVKPEEFLDAAHELPDLPSMIRYERGLFSLIQNLPGKKILLTNSAYRYSREVLKHLGLRKNFMRHVSIERMKVNGRLSPKPSKRLLLKLIASEKTSSSQCVLIDDSENVLKTAHSIGMQTVWVTRYAKKDRFSGHASPVKKKKQSWQRPGFVDMKIYSIKKLSRYFSKGMSKNRN